MKVLYELDLNDIIRIVADKYEVNPAKIKKISKDGLNYLTVDMSETETPGKVKFDNPPISSELMKKVMEMDKKWHERNKPIEKKEPEPTDEDVQESSYKFITDEVLEAKIKAGKTIPEICADFSLTDSKYSARLYKRAEKFRTEGARLGRRSNKEKAEGTEQTAG